MFIMFHVFILISFSVNLTEDQKIWFLNFYCKLCVIGLAPEKTRVNDRQVSVLFPFYLCGSVRPLPDSAGWLLKFHWNLFVCITSHTMTRAQFHRAVKQENLLSTGKFCLAKTGYQPKCHVKYTVCDWFPAIFCLINKFVKQYFLFSSSMELGPVA